jgi:hypothetical protein
MDDWGFEDFDQVAATPEPQAAGGRELVPEGRHGFRVERAGEDDTSLKVTLAHPDKRMGWVWDTMPKGNGIAKARLASLLRALGVQLDDWRRMDPGDLIGRHVEAEIYHKVGSKGGTFVNVRKYYEAEPAPAAAKPAAARSQAAKAHKATTEGNADAIPF